MTQFDALTQQRRFFGLVLTGLSAALALSILLAVCFGTVQIGSAEAYRIIIYKVFAFDRGDTPPLSLAHIDIIWQIRLPRVLMAAITGAGLALCGTVMQASLQNPLAEPFILGISSGASLGAAFSILVGASAFGTPFWAFTGALAATFLVMLLSGSGGQISAVKMVLSGTIANALFGALTNFIIYATNNAEGIRTVAFWTMGSLAAAKWQNLTLPAFGVTGFCLFFLAQHRTLNALLLGEETAVTLGIDSGNVRRIYFIFTALITGLIVSSCGVIGFVAFVVPHIVRGLVGSDHKKLTPSAILAGALFLTWADVLARIALPSGELPIGIITALIGAPFFMYILWKQAYSFCSR